MSQEDYEKARAQAQRSVSHLPSIYIYISVRGGHFIYRIFSGQDLATQKKDMEALRKQEATAKDSTSRCIFMCECLIRFRHCLLLPAWTYSM